MLSESQFALIKAEIDKSSISVEEVKDDLLDHFCCSVEQYMSKGLSFESAYQKAWMEVCPGGLNEIGFELFLEVDLPKIIGLQKVKYSLGLLLTIIIIAGALFKVLHWPGANNLLLMGIAGFLALFLPILAYDKYKGSVLPKNEIVKDSLGFVSLFLLGTGTLLKISHLTGGAILLAGGAVLFTFGFLPCLFLEMYHNSLQQKIQNKAVKV